MDLRQLEYFVAIARCGGINKAAAKLHIAQSALSRHVQQLEHELGATLLERSAQGVRLTPAGALVNARAAALLQAARDLRIEVKARSGAPEGPVAIAIPGVLRPMLAAPLLHQLGETYPDLEVTISTAMSGEIREAILTGRADLGVYGALTADPALTSEPILRDDLLVVGAPGSPVAGRGVLTPQEVAALPLVVLNRDTLRQLFATLSADVDLAYGKVLEVSDGPLQIEMVMAGRYCSILPRIMVQGHLDRGELCSAKLSGAFYHWRIAHAADRPLSVAGRLAYPLLAACAAERLTPGLPPATALRRTA